MNYYTIQARSPMQTTTTTSRFFRRTSVVGFIILFLLCIGVIAGFEYAGVSKADSLKQSTVNTTSSDIPVSVEVDTVSLQKIPSTTTVFGTIQPRAEVPLVSEVSGHLIYLGVKVGDDIKKGEVIARVDPALKESALASVRVVLDKAKRDVQRTEQLHSEGNMSLSDVESARLHYASALASYTVAEKERDNCTIRAPFSGVVTSMNIHYGSVIQQGIPLLQLMDNTELHVATRISEQILPRMKSGMKVKVMTPLFPEKEFIGTVRMNATRADANRMFTIEVVLPKNPFFKPGQSAEVNIDNGLDMAITIPQISVVDIGNSKRGVYVVDTTTNKVTQRNVELGAEVNTESVIVQQGLSVGERIVTNGTHTIRNGSRIRF
jgi:RND family efflux transporter MFP subunit